MVCLAMPPALSAGPLHQAVRARDLITLESLLNPAADIDINEKVSHGATALHLAAAIDFYQAVKTLIEHGADVNAKTETGFTPLHWAASKNAVESIELLLDNGADVNAKAKSNITPLHWAAGKNASDAVKLLLAAGADINAKTGLGYSPLHLAVKNNPYSKSAVLLAEAQADIEDQAGFLTVTDLKEPEIKDEEEIVQSDEELPDTEEKTPVKPGSFLDVTLGPGSSLEFVWIETLKIWFGKYEITNRQYRQYNIKHISRATEGLVLDLADQPAVYVSWEDASDYCNWLTTTYSNRIPLNCEFRLPTAEEWEFTAACGDERRYPWGNEWPPLYGNHSDMTARKNLSQWRGILGYDDGYTVTCLVEDSGMNEWGIYGLAGNVWEWCDDWMDNADRRLKIRKGGSWDFDTKESLRVLANGFDRPSARYDTIGFRVIVAPKRTTNDER
jgi:hypothetical protein